MAKLDGKKIAFLFTDGVEQVELEEPLKAVRNEGADVDLVSLEVREIQAFNHLEQGYKIKVDKAVSDVCVSDYVALVVHGGVANPDFLRMDEDAVNFVRGFAEAGKPAGVICHGPWMLVESGVVHGMTVTSWPSLQTDIRNAGGNWVDKEVVVDRGVVTSRKPDDIPAYNKKMIEEFKEGSHADKRQRAGAAP
jgi:protease I